MRQLLTALFIIFWLLGCKQPEQKTIPVHSDNSPPDRDTSNQYIYDFMEVMIAQQVLDLNHGLALNRSLIVTYRMIASS